MPSRNSGEEERGQIDEKFRICFGMVKMDRLYRLGQI